MGARRGTASAAVAVLLLVGCAESSQQPSDTPGSTASATTDPAEPSSPTAAPSQSTTARPSGSATGPAPAGTPSQPSRSAPSTTTTTPAAPQSPTASDGTEEPTPKAPREIVGGTVAEALAAWLADEGLEYAGPCEETELPEDVGRYCSRVVEERGTAVVAMIGPAFSEFTVYLLIERTDRGWIVVRSADVPGPDEQDTGLPF